MASDGRRLAPGSVYKRMIAIALSTLFTAAAPAQTLWPITCDTADGWQAQPDAVAQPSTRATVTSQQGAVTFTVPDPNAAMRWSLPVLDYAPLRWKYILMQQPMTPAPIIVTRQSDWGHVGC